MSKKQKSAITTLGIFAFVVSVGLISFTGISTDQFFGQFNIEPIVEPGQPQPEPDIEIWKLTHLPTIAPPGTLIIEEQVINDEQFIMDLAVQSVYQDAELRQIAFEVDLDDNDQTLSKEEASLINGLDHLTLITENGNILSSAKFEIIDNRVMAIFRATGIQLTKGRYASLKIQLTPLPNLQQDQELRLQLTLTETFATLPNGSEALIYADLGDNNNGNLNDDLVASGLVNLR